MRVATSIPDLSTLLNSIPRPLGLVPTMGALHDGHLALVEKARRENQSLVATIFVNPTQFGPQEDLSGYPRDENRDLDMLRQHGVDLVFAPTAEEMYPQGFDTWVDVGALGDRLEGAHRPGHFRGVATVVTKLFGLVRPDRAYFGQKDGQQLAVIRRIVRDLNLGLEVVAVPTVRDPDGLAQSSRNAYLTPSQRKAAPVVYRSLCRAKTLWSNGERDADKLRAEVRAGLEGEPLVETIDYASVAHAESLDELDQASAGAMVSVAVRIGRTRLIDNLILE
ncbi:MAG: pantoate--beta-alanine ligase [SAR202 cluster bacterium Io17-Chloro-G2]|nr:MAG: pantoate--beta-alanine ligase [SAR202 cluster bacterium Io17-Chloro-G2]